MQQSQISAQVLYNAHQAGIAAYHRGATEHTARTNAQVWGDYYSYVYLAGYLAARHAAIKDGPLASNVIQLRTNQTTMGK
jgi:hypothetical protein